MPLSSGDGGFESLLEVMLKGVPLPPRLWAFFWVSEPEPEGLEFAAFIPITQIDAPFFQWHTNFLSHKKFTSIDYQL